MPFGSGLSGAKIHHLPGHRPSSSHAEDQPYIATGRGIHPAPGRHPRSRRAGVDDGPGQLDRPLLDFSTRVLTLIDDLPELIHRLPANNRIGKRIFYKFVRIVIDIVKDPLVQSGS